MAQKGRYKAQKASKQIPYISAHLPAICPLYALKSGKTQAGVVAGSGECAAVMGGEGAKMVRPQGGGGIDHPNKVQQKRTQIDFSDPRGYSYPLSNMDLGYEKVLWYLQSLYGDRGQWFSLLWSL